MNSGQRVIIERRGDHLYLTLTQYGNQYHGEVASLSFAAAGASIDRYIDALRHGRPWDKERRKNIIA